MTKEGPYTKLGAIAGVVGIVVTYFITAAQYGWLPFHPSIFTPRSPSAVTDMPSIPQIPDVVGKQLPDAKGLLTAAGVKSVRTVEHLNVNESEPDDMVAGQEPAAGRPVPPEVVLTVGRAPVITYLTDLRPTKFGWGGEAVPATIGKAPYDHSLLGDVARDGGCADVRNRSSNYQISSGRQRFRAAFGLDDTSSDNSTVVRIQVLGDGRSLFDQRVTYGRHIDADVDVSQYTMLTLAYNFVSGTGSYSGCSEAKVIAGSARFLSMRE